MTTRFNAAYAHPAFDEARRFAGGDVAASRARLAALARLLDSAFRIPGTEIRMGADAALNLIPGAGTLFAKGLSGYLIWEARRLGAPKATLVRMLGNLGVDFAISIVPLAGWVGDIFFRANKRNMALLDQHLAGLERTGR
jgi:hypothetical protein